MSVHCAHQTVQLLRCETPKFIGQMVRAYDLQLTVILVLLNTTKYEAWVAECVYLMTVQDMADPRQQLINTWNGIIKHSRQCH